MGRSRQMTPLGLVIGEINSGCTVERAQLVIVFLRRNVGNTKVRNISNLRSPPRRVDHRPGTRGTWVIVKVKLQNPDVLDLDVTLLKEALGESQVLRLISLF